MSRNRTTTMEQQLVQLRPGPTMRKLVTEIFGMAHTLKGNAAVIQADDLVEFAHVPEDRSRGS